MRKVSSEVAKDNGRSKPLMLSPSWATPCSYALWSMVADFIRQTNTLYQLIICIQYFHV